MDDEGKIKDIVSQSKKTFLDWKNLEVGSQELYDLEVEFAATRKNRNYVVMITLLVFLIAVVGTAYAVTRYIQEAGKIVPVQIKDFEDVNLKDILDVAKNYEQKLRKARNDLENIKSNMNREIENINSKADRDIGIIMAGGDSDEVKRTKVAAVYRNRNGETARTRERYSSQIAEKEKEIAEIETAMASYDAAVLEKARQQDEILNNQRKMAEIELQQTIDRYEERISQLTSKYEAEIASIKRDNTRLVNTLVNKLDPVFTSAELKKILSEEMERSDIVPADESALAVLEKNQVSATAEIGKIREEAGKIDILLNRVKEVPYGNSVGVSIRRIFEKELFVRKGYEKVVQKSADTIEERNSRLSFFSNAFDFYIQNSGVSGYVIDPADSSAIFVYMNRILDIRDGDTAYVFRSDNEPIGEIGFYLKDGMIFARELPSALQGEEEKKPVQPFDRILVKIK